MNFIKIILLTFSIIFGKGVASLSAQQENVCYLAVSIKDQSTIKEKAEEVDIANRTTKNAEELSEFATSIGLSTNVKKIEEIKNLQNYNIIINSTSLGLKNESSPISFEQINQDSVIYDIVYSPMNTDFIKKAKDKKLEVIYGYEMLLGQATRAFEIWHEMKAPYNAMKKALLGGF